MAKYEKEFSPNVPSTIGRGSELPEYFKNDKVALNERYTVEHITLVSPAGVDVIGSGLHIPGSVGFVHVSDTAPTTLVKNSAWYNTGTDTLNFYDGSAWVGGFTKETPIGRNYQALFRNLYSAANINSVNSLSYLEATINENPVGGVSTFYTPVAGLYLISVQIYLQQY